MNEGEVVELILNMLENTARYHGLKSRREGDALYISRYYDSHEYEVRVTPYTEKPE